MEVEDFCTNGYPDPRVFVKTLAEIWKDHDYKTRTVSRGSQDYLTSRQKMAQIMQELEVFRE